VKILSILRSIGDSWIRPSFGTIHLNERQKKKRGLRVASRSTMMAAGGYSGGIRCELDVSKKEDEEEITRQRTQEKRRGAAAT